MIYISQNTKLCLKNYFYLAKFLGVHALILTEVEQKDQGRVQGLHREVEASLAT